MKLHLETLDHRTAFLPGETIEGIAGWELDEQPDHIDVRLFWHTAGKGTQDVEIADSVVFRSPPAVDAQPFRLTAPRGPYSFSGKLVSLTWSIEVVVGGAAERIDIVIAPAGEPIQLGVVEKRSKRKAAMQP